MSMRPPIKRSSASQLAKLVWHELRRHYLRLRYYWLPAPYYAARFYFSERPRRWYGWRPYNWGMSCTDEFYGFRFRLKTERSLSVGGDPYGVIGISIDTGWYGGAISIGFVLLGRWRGCFIDLSDDIVKQHSNP